APPRRFRSRHPRNQHRDRTPTLLATQFARRPYEDWHLVVPPTPAAASRPGVRRAAAALSITPPRNQRWDWNPTLLATQFARRPCEDWHLVVPPTPAAASRPGVRRAAAALSIMPAAKPAPESDPTVLGT